MTVIAEQMLDLASSDDGVTVRVWAPQQTGPDTWRCRCEIGAPIGETIETDGASGLQALALAIKKLSAALYSTEVFRTGQLGAFGSFDGYLGLPAPSSFKDIAPCTF